MSTAEHLAHHANLLQDRAMHWRTWYSTLLPDGYPSNAAGATETVSGSSSHAGVLSTVLARIGASEDRNGVDVRTQATTLTLSLYTLSQAIQEAVEGTPVAYKPTTVPDALLHRSSQLLWQAAQQYTRRRSDTVLWDAQPLPMRDAVYTWLNGYSARLCAIVPGQRAVEQKNPPRCNHQGCNLLGVRKDDKGRELCWNHYKEHLAA